MDFIYLGQTEVSSEDLGNFLQVSEYIEVRGLQSKLENKEQINGLKNYITMEKIEEDKTILDDVGSGNPLKDRSVLVPTCLLMEETS